MSKPDRKSPKSLPIEEVIRSAVSNHLYDTFASDEGGIGCLDKWTQRRVYDENMAKVALLLEDEDPAEHCYQNLIREIDTEAENGIYLVGTKGQDNVLRRLVDDPGISGELYLEVDSTAQRLYADEVAHSSENMDLVWVTIQARYDRARLDASVTELVMRYLLNSVVATEDMTNALRALLYSFHEDLVRRVCDLPSILDERESRDLLVMVLELEKRCGSYDERIRLIQERSSQR
jgi:hypothetical protein